MKKIRKKPNYNIHNVSLPENEIIVQKLLLQNKINEKICRFFFNRFQFSTSFNSEKFHYEGFDN